MDYIKEIAAAGLTQSQYESCLKTIYEKKSGITDIDWSEIVSEHNLMMSPEMLRKSSAGIFGGAFVAGYMQNKVPTDGRNHEEMKKLLKAQEETYKQRVRMRDERNELNRVLREQARNESFIEQIVKEINDHVDADLFDASRDHNISYGENEMVVTLFDLHTGIIIDNAMNTYNQDILKERLLTYLDKVLDVQVHHGTKKCTVLLSELISGLIHSQLRLETNQDIIQQFLTAMDLVTEFVEELSYNFDTVNVYVMPANHSRITADKKESMKGENLDLLVVPFMKARLQNFRNVHCFENTIDSSVAVFEVCGKKCAAAHGDKDNFDNVVQKYTMWLGFKPYVIWLGHRHYNAMTTVYDTKVIQAGCLSGSDEYCMDKRLRNRAEQIITVMNNDGLDCLYDVKF